MEVLPETASKSPSAHSLARVAIRDHIGKIYGVEREIETQRERRERVGKEWTLEETHAIRQQKSAPIMAGFKRCLEDLAPGVAPKSALGKAIGYCINHWDKLARFVDHADAPPDNNRVESPRPRPPSNSSRSCPGTSSRCEA